MAATGFEKPTLGSDHPPAGASSRIDPELERQYNLRIRHPERTGVYERFSAESAKLRASAPGLRALRYGDSTNSVVDFLPADTAAPAPLFLFIHGGYWRALDRSIFTFLAKPWLARGVHVALPGYDLAPTASLHAIVAQIHKAAGSLLADADGLGIDRRRLIVGGHSAGAHLGALLLNALPAGAAVVGFVGVSGIYDLEPLLSTTINSDVRLGPAEARALSPRWCQFDAGPHHLYAVGSAETEGFKQQSREHAAALKAQGCDAELMEVPGRTHFDILDDLADEKALLFRRAHAMLCQPFDRSFR